MKILHVLISPRAEGTPRLVLDWLAVDGYEQELLFLSPDGQLRENFEHTGAWQYYNTAFVPRFKSAFKIANLVRRIVLQRKPQIVISWTLGFSHWIALGARQAGVKHNLAHAGNPPSDTFIGRNVHTWISLGLGRLFGNKIIACSSYVRNEYLTIPFMSKDHIYAVYNCVNIKRFIPSHSPGARNPDYVMVATLEVHKDHATLLHAWNKFSPDHPMSKLLIAGDGSLWESLKALSASLELQRIEFLGSIIDVPSLLHRCTTFVFSTTHNEGFGTVLIEALAAGCKVIATDVAACREVLEDGRYGVLVDPHDPNALAETMRQQSSVPLTQRMMAEQLAYAKKFSPEEMIRNYVAIAMKSQV